MKYFIFPLSLLFFLFSCSRNNQDIETLAIDIEASRSNREVSIYDIFSKIEVIALDDTYLISNSIHTGEAYITFDGDNFYILDNSSYKVNVYTSDGRILYHSDKVGRGKGEYTMAYQIEYDPYDNKIEILNPMGKILRYNTDSLKFESELNFMGNPLSTHNFLHIKDSYILYSAREDDKLYSLDNKTREVKSYGYSPEEYLRKYISPQSPFFYINHDPCIFRPYDGTIFRFDVGKHTLEPIIKWDFRKYQCRLKDIPPDKSAREYHDFILKYSKKHIAAFTNIKSTKNRLFASVIFKGEIYTLYYNTSQNNYFFFNETSEGIKFLPELFYNDIMYKYADSSSLPDFIKKELLDSHSQKEYDKIIKDDCSAIIKYTLKQ